ncbi:MAG: hypothetical protein KatS3mg077_1568 [Candidatus Binatia bacterium]|nr:MAG: hypothetical protein KatS3mg077_1568 [Candidatus Binatia bacterium]
MKNVSDSTAVLRALADNVWVADRPLDLLVGNIGARMTIVRLQSGGLFIHSPVLPDAPTCAALRSIGPVVGVVAPNKTHHFFVRRFQQAFPEAEFWIAPGLVQKRPELGFANSLTDNAPPLWSSDLAQLHVRGIPVLEEVVFFHPSSKTLILTDLVFNMPAEPRADWRLKLFLRLNDARGRFGPTRLVRNLIRDRRAFRAALERILEWDFERIVMSHGAVLEHRGREAFAQAFAPWL